MKATYKGFTGRIKNLNESSFFDKENIGNVLYDLSIYDSESCATISFEGVDLKDVKFSGGEVSFNG